MWRDILLANQQEVRHQSRLFRQALVRLEHSMAEGRGDTLQQLLKQASTARADWQPLGKTGQANGKTQQVSGAEIAEDDSHEPSRTRFSLSSFFGTGM
jgi:hypothetical protein